MEAKEQRTRLQAREPANYLLLIYRRSCASMHPRHTTAKDGGNVGIAGAFSDRTSCT